MPALIISIIHIQNSTLHARKRDLAFCSFWDIHEICTQICRRSQKNITIIFFSTALIWGIDIRKTNNLILTYSSHCSARKNKSLRQLSALALGNSSIRSQVAFTPENTQDLCSPHTRRPPPCYDGGTNRGKSTC